VEGADEVVDDEGVEVPGQEIQDQPVAQLLQEGQLGLFIISLRLQNGFHVRTFSLLGSFSGDDGNSDLNSQDHGEPCEHNDSGDDGQKDEPEPDEDVNLFVNDVQR